MTQKTRGQGPWSLGMELLRLARNDIFTLGDGCQGILSTGGIGSGKTTGPVRCFSRALLRSGAGALFLCAKINSADEFEAMALEENRQVIRVKPGVGFNFLDYLARSGGNAGPVIAIIREAFEWAAEVLNRGG